MLRAACLTFLAIVFVPATVQAFDHHDHHIHHTSSHHSGNGCGGSSSESEESSPSEHETTTPSPSTSTSTPPAGHKLIFVTTTTYAGALGGLAAADAYCNSAASEHGLTGSYRAWLSSGTTDAYDRMTGNGPYDNTAGKTVFASRAAMREAPSANLLDEEGNAPSNIAAVGAWSGSDNAGLHAGADCAGWTDATDLASASTGSARVGDPAWGGGDAPARCSSKAPLLCVEQ
jgi:hypothetical protein